MTLQGYTYQIGDLFTTSKTGFVSTMDLINERSDILITIEFFIIIRIKNIYILNINLLPNI